MAKLILDSMANVFCFLQIQKRTFSLAGNQVPWQSTGGVQRYTCRMPHFHTLCHLDSRSRIVYLKMSVSHAHVMDHIAPHLTRNTSTRSLSLASCVPIFFDNQDQTCCPRLHLDGSFPQNPSSTKRQRRCVKCLCIPCHFVPHAPMFFERLGRCLLLTEFLCQE